MRSVHTTSFSPVDDRFEFHKSGSFRCRRKHDIIYCTVYTAIVVLIVSGIWIFSIRAEANLASIIFTLIFDALKLISVIAAPLLLIGGLRMILSGDEYRYTANSEKMLITCPSINYRADIYYNKLVGVEYNEIKVTDRPTGYNVVVHCTDCIYKYAFLFPKTAVVRHPDMTPFRILEEQAGFLDRPEYVMGKRIDNIGLK